MNLRPAQEDDTPGKVVGVTSLASTLMTLKRYEDAQKTIATSKVPAGA